MRTIKIEGENELPSVATVVLDYLDKYDIVCLNGEMGAGKTTFTKVIGELLGVTDAMSSPTFSIVNEYLCQNGESVYHFDFYRVEDQREALDIGVDEYFYSGNLCLIEWAENIKDLIPEEHLEINIKLVGDKGREITISPNGG